MVYDDIPNIDVSFTVEGFKEALTTRYRNDPNRDYNHVREEIERNTYWFERMVGPHFPGAIPKRITRLKVLWMNESLTLRTVEFGY
ncbi:unnamed protein product [Cuscuta campestris]|uniref:Uncharacterized protein n=1 Tax=Cuscuta campestris TaxID=132261 RepID=A0A484M7R4_9ASTE|nr:unnamed protein product [Cuscuta campestris]